MKIISFNKKIFIIITCLILLITSTIAVFFAAKEISSSNYTHTIVIDAGHGGIDAGARGINTDIKESDINLKLAFLLKDKFENYGIKVVLTRDNKDSLANPNVDHFKREDMKLRKKVILDTSPEFVLSIHMNKYSLKSRRGAQTFFTKTESSKALAECIQSSLNFNINKPYVKRDFAALYGDYYLLKCSDFPSVIIECGFLSNPEDEVLLSQDYYLDELTYCIFSACLGYIAMQDNL
jgi:N-acetylmuramoyl-L-alanine amidase